MEQEIEQPADNEQGYRYHYLQADIRLSTLVILIWMIAVVIFIPVDYFSLGHTKEFYVFLAARLLFTICILAVIFGFRHTTKPYHYDILISVVILLGIVFSIFGCFMFENDYVGQLILDILLIITIYTIFPGPLSTKVIACLSLSAKAVYFLLNHEQILTASKASILTGIVMTNVLGFFTWKAIQNFRRQQFTYHIELIRARKEAEILARIDPLTDVNNRRAFMEHGHEEFLRSRRYPHPLSLALIDIDNFKSINDQYGHQTGDLALKNLSQAINKQIREQDILGRIGGDEFGLLLPETSLEEAQVIITRLSETFRQTIIEFQNQHFSTSFSAGLATIQPSDQSFEQMLQRSDQALYKAKAAGKGHIEK